MTNRPTHAGQRLEPPDSAAPPAPPDFQTPYPSYQVMSKWHSPSFDEPTRRVIAERIHHVPERRFLEEGMFALLRAVVDCILPQPERSERERIPVEAFLDEMLQDNRGNGTRLAGTPTQRAAWIQGLHCIEHECERRHACGFAGLSREAQSAVLRAIDAGDVDEAFWRSLHPRRFLRSILLKEAVKAYYAHPLAWNEIGFGGPAAPRGYVRLGPDERDPWEALEERAPQPVKGLG